MKSNNNILSFLTINDLPYIINNWYFKAYCKIIQNALKENRKKLKKDDLQYVYYESHHIHPRSLGGSDDRSNLVLLTKHEHFLVHWLLTKCISGKQKYSMMRAFDKMLSECKGQERYIPKHKFAKIIKQNREGIVLSDEHKTKISKARMGKPAWNKGKSAWNKGKPHSDEHKRKISEAGKGRPAPNKGKPHSDEHKAKISKANSGKQHSEETKQKISEANKGNQHSEEAKQKMRKPKSEEHKRKISEANSGKPAWNKGKSGYKRHKESK